MLSRPAGKAAHSVRPIADLALSVGSSSSDIRSSARFTVGQELGGSATLPPTEEPIDPWPSQSIRSQVQRHPDFLQCIPRQLGINWGRLVTYGQTAPK